ncbi:hypothetical protein LOZ61_004055 [Ophidiomyces ophidiicola]|uniref:Uncharacterized protein n=1 Tax=Ophidiomyces ophidiicola TaxID=1387563 RepID=A0ACB8UWJ2_9EURO|nr:hypothetical protein LOZ61_004055 [Ophidiomyces ophidiicola]KAI1931243.1 hypothetical protein LOZ60_000272 [Ophidiomyces ophidiicola]KAI1956763.1 hypothetical protein LOZ59_004179 [Ophidiomyces ophidiicola]KAI1974605.1 hypothetical protein LOZ56_001127 [Ophidiomyces ophidiicola]KAI2032441.1 hypothetical protein LOZ48_002414 [Ophidiomyces ophidiicola]
MKTHLDRDGDSEMLSSSESSGSSAAINPIPQTPTDLALNTPQASQQHQQSTAAAAIGLDGGLLTPGAGGVGSGGSSSIYPITESTSAAADEAAPSTMSVDDQSSPTQAKSEEALILEGEPGASWNTAKAQEEYQQMMTMVTDRDFSLNEFGDPFDDRDMEMGDKLI